MKFILAVLSYIILTFAIAYPWHLIWFHDLYVSWGAVTRDKPIIPLGMLAMLIQAVIIAYLFPKLQKPGNSIKQAVIFSWLLGALIWSVMGPATAAKFAIVPVHQFLIYHTIFQIIQFTITGVSLGLIYNKKTNIT